MPCTPTPHVGDVIRRLHRAQVVNHTAELDALERWWLTEGDLLHLKVLVCARERVTDLPAGVLAITADDIFG